MNRALTNSQKPDRLIVVFRMASPVALRNSEHTRNAIELRIFAFFSQFLQGLSHWQPLAAILVSVFIRLWIVNDQKVLLWLNVRANEIVAVRNRVPSTRKQFRILDGSRLTIYFHLFYRFEFGNRWGYCHCWQYSKIGCCSLWVCEWANRLSELCFAEWLSDQGHLDSG